MRLFPLLSMLACSNPEPEPEIIDAVSARDTRYCEVIPLFLEGDVLDAEVWNTVGFNDCPQASWDSLDADAIRDEVGATLVLMNGPRSFLMDEATVAAEGQPRTATFGDLEMFLAATFRIAFPADQSPYVERSIDRENVFSFWKGSEVYELLAPDGSAYVMQAYAMIVDPDLSEDDLAGLGGRLELPDGWTFQARVLDAQLDVDTAGQGAVVIQDELQNTYQKYAWPE